MSDRLIFINLSGTKGKGVGKDEVTKAQVRSQVMKNLRRKQRLVDQKRYEETLLAAGAQSASKACSSRSSDDGGRKVKMAVPVGAAGRGREGVIDLSVRNTSPSIASSSTGHCSSGTATDRTHRHKQEENPIFNPETMQQDFGQDSHLEPVAFLQSFHGWQAGGSNPSSTRPEEFLKLVSTMESYTRFLSEPLILTRSTGRPGAAPAISRMNHCFEHTSHNELILFTVRLTHLGHTTAVRFLRENKPICIRAKANALTRLQRSVREVIRNPPIELIGAVLLVLSFEMIRGGESAPVHRDGLSRLVGLHRDMGCLTGPEDSLFPAIFACDLIISASSPLDLPRHVPMHRPCLTGEEMKQSVDFFRSSPLMRAERFEELSGLYKHHSVPQLMIDILNDVFQATLEQLSDSLDSSVTTSTHKTIMSCPAQDSCHFSHSNAPPFPMVVLQASRLASTIFFRATRQGIPFEDPVNNDDAKHLGTLLNATPLSAWRGIPYIYLWVLLTGSAAAQSFPEKQYFMAELVRYGFSIALEYVEDFKQILMNFIWLRQSIQLATNIQ